jgi:hypothetical protein
LDRREPDLSIILGLSSHPPPPSLSTRKGGGGPEGRMEGGGADTKVCIESSWIRYSTAVMMNYVSEPPRQNIITQGWPQNY